MSNFQECPFFVDEIVVHSIYRSLSPGNFFITFKHENVISKPIIIVTPYNPFSKYICSCSTVWHPDFEQMKALLFLGVKVKEDYTEDERRLLLEKEDDLIVFGTYDFNEDCKHILGNGQNTFKRKIYKFLVDNKNKSIRIIHEKID
jgi:hypothetical protein